MISLITGHSDEVAAWVASHIPHVSRFDRCEAIAVMSGHRIIAGVVYHDYQPAFRTIQISMAAVSPLWARKEIIAKLLQYPFEQLECYKCWTATPIDNTMAIKVNEHIGFKREAVCNSMFGKGRHGVLMRFLEPDYNKLYRGKVYGKVSSVTSPAA